MSANLNNVTAPDAYKDTIMLRAPGSTSLFLSVSNQAVYYQLGHGPGGGAVAWDEGEAFRLPGYYELDVDCDAVRIRAAVAAAELAPPLIPAQVTATLE